MAHRAVGAVTGAFGGGSSEAVQEPAAAGAGGQVNQQAAASMCDNDKQGCKYTHQSVEQMLVLVVLGTTSKAVSTDLSKS